jgi:competence protein ComEC
MRDSILYLRWSRPFLWLVTVFLLGIAAEHCCSLGASVVWSAVSALFLLVLLLPGLFPQGASWRVPVIALLLFCTLGFVAGRLARPDLPAPTSLEPFFDGPQTLFLGHVSSPLDFYPDKARFSVQLHAAVLEGQSVPLHGGVLLSLGKARAMPSEWFPGDKLALRLNLKHLHNFANPGGYDYVRSQAERGIYARAYVPDDRFMVKLTESSPSFPMAIVQEVRSELERFRQRALLWLQGSLPPDEAAFYAGLLLGYQNLLSDSWREHLNRAGVTHLLSISGLHMGLVALLVFWIVRQLLRMLFPFVLHRLDDQRIAVWPALMAAATYALIAGFSVPPIWRSMIMLTICFGAAYWYVAADPFSVLAASALVILLVDPNSLWQISFQLTFVCMFAIFSLYPKFEPFHLTSCYPPLARNKFPGRLIAPFEEAFWLSLAVNIMVLPLTAYYFQGVSLAGFLANIVLVPLTGFLVLPLGLVSLGVFTFNDKLALPILKLGGFFLEVFQTLLTWFSQLSWSYFWVGSVSILFLVTFYAGLTLLLTPWRLKNKAVGIILLIVFGFVMTFAQHVLHRPDELGKLQITSIDVGQGSSTLLRFPSGTTMLVDGGGFYNDAFDVGRAVLAPFLWHSGINRLDYIVLSHDHPDHRNGLTFVLSHFDVGCLWESGLTDSSQSGSELAGIAARRKIPVRQLSEIFGRHTIDGCEVQVIHPSSSYLQSRWDGRNLNNVSLVLQVNFGETTLILPGDIDQSVEPLLFRERKPSNQLLLVSPHHGSEHSNPPSLFDDLRPQTVVFSCGYDNLFGFPSPTVLAECRKRNIPVFRTDLQGAIQATSDGLCWEIRPTNGQVVSPISPKSSIY